MMHLFLTVLAISLTALLVAGGVNYFSSDVGVRLEVSHALQAQHDALSTALSTYRTANGGYVSEDISFLEPYMPTGTLTDPSGGKAGMSWSVVKDGSAFKGLCAERAAPVPQGVAEGIVRFSEKMSRQRPGSVFYGSDCAGAVTAVDDASSPLANVDFTSTNIALLIEGD